MFDDENKKLCLAISTSGSYNQSFSTGSSGLGRAKPVKAFRASNNRPLFFTFPSCHSSSSIPVHLPIPSFFPFPFLSLSSIHFVFLSHRFLNLFTIHSLPGGRFTCGGYRYSICVVDRRNQKRARQLFVFVRLHKRH
ncbi:hypothetical protein BJ508DRAFT_222497 [Ascobolus immersus RN42]|uniref:Uncharacterized protein n=1 Tax=Ascobolus immersus RN42 TaxID=1160509 RepID=A0A3N4IL59_ASCIM|nr:hypothetical protein BJ508DRAFT_222497 [Ascobolus immersus RN42]